MQGSSSLNNQFPVNQSSSKPQPPPPKATSKYSHTFIVVDLKSGLMGRTHDEKLASSPKNINQFMKKFGSTLSYEQANQLQSSKLINSNIVKLKDSNLPAGLKKILIKAEKALSALDNFLSIGKSNKELTSDSREIAQKKAQEMQKKTLEEYSEIKDKFLSKVKEYRKESFNLNQLKNQKNALVSQSGTPKQDSELKNLEHKIQEGQRKLNRLGHEMGHFVVPEKGDTKEDLLTKKYLANESVMKEPEMVEFKAAALRKAPKKVQQNPQAEVKLDKEKTKETEKFTVSTNFNDRSENAKALKVDKRAYYKRSEEDPSIRKTVREHYSKDLKAAPDNKTLGVAAEFNRLRANASFEQIESASKNKIAEKAKGVVTFDRAIKSGSELIAGELNDLLQKLPDDNIQSFDDMKAALKKQVITNNQQTFTIDRETFEHKMEYKIPDLATAPRAQLLNLEKMLNDDTWPEGYEETISYTKLPANNLNQFSTVIDLFFQDADVRRVLNQFF